MFLIAANRANLKQRWEEAIKEGINLVEEIKIPFPEEKEYKTVKSMYLNRTISNLLITLGFTMGIYFQSFLQALARSARNIKTPQDLYYIIALIFIGGIIFFGRQTYKTLKLYLKYRDISKDLQQIGNALLLSLVNAKAISTDISKLKVITTMDDWGAVYCHLEGGTTFEKSTFINALQEIVRPIDNPRYVIIRKNRFMLLIKQKDYHAVPELLGKNKNLAEHFKNQWEKLVGSCELIFTRTINGRKLLLKSRIKSLSIQFEDKVERVNKWR